MTVDTAGTDSPTVFDAGLPAIAYEHAQNPEEAHRLIRQARLQGPIALGPHGPEVLSYELVRSPNVALSAQWFEVERESPDRG